MAQLAHLLRPLLATALIEPHATDILQETGSTLDTPLVGEVELIGTIVDDCLFGLYTHQTPRTTGQVGKLLVLCRNSSNSSTRIVTSNSNHGYGSQTGYLLHLFRQHTNLCTGLYHPSELTTLHTDALDEFL